MGTFDLKGMDLKDLEKLRREVEQAISSFNDRKRAEARAALEATAREYGFSVADLVDGATKRAGRLPAKFANPGDTAKTWSGHGRRPTWVNDYLDAGGTLDEIRV